MHGLARYFWAAFVHQAREFISQLAEPYPKEYCRQLEIVHLLEALYKHHTGYGLVNAEHLGIIDKVQVAGYFFDE
ncbi:unnamed protein product [Calypogeia fissa]